MSTSHGCHRRWQTDLAARPRRCGKTAQNRKPRQTTLTGCLPKMRRETEPGLMAARAGEKVNIPPVYPEEMSSGDEVTPVVIFGDSLADTGRPKKRFKVFPMDPYWLGRFSNGPAWPEYLAMATGMGIQNHACGGLSGVA